MNQTQPEIPENPYDEVPYPNYSFGLTHPVRIATLAALFKLDPPPLQGYRFLEMGCARGANIIPMAAMDPDSEYIGVDYSAKQVAEAHKTIKALGLKNVHIEHMSIADISEDLGTFDYIVCHGVFSWVAREVRDAIFAVCRDRLSDNGLAYVSYNTYPGWHLSGMVRDMMLYHTARFSDSRTRLVQARALLAFLAESVDGEHDPAYAAVLKAQINIIGNAADDYLFHDHLEKENAPLYFHEFAEWSKQYGLDFVGEANVSSMWIADMKPEVREKLEALKGNVLETEQYLDFLRNRMFRQSILCHEGRKIDRAINTQDLASYWIASPLKTPPADVDLKSTEAVTFPGRSKGSMTVTNPITKAALTELANRYPHSCQVSDLIAHAIRRLGASDAQIPAPDSAVAATLFNDLARCYLAGLAELTLRPFKFTVEIGDRPEAPAVVRHQAAHGDSCLTSRRHESVGTNDFHRFIIARLDGKHDMATICAQIIDETVAGNFTLRRDNGPPITDRDELGQLVPQLVEAQMKHIADNALLQG